MAATNVRFNYIPPLGNLSYRGLAEIIEALDDNDDLLRTIDLLEVWEFDYIGYTYTEIFPYQKGFDRSLRAELEFAAIEAVSYPPKYDVVLPSDWKILDTHTCCVCLNAFHGIRPLTGGNRPGADERRGFLRNRYD